MSDSQVAVTGVGVERHEDNLRTFLCGDPRQFRKFDVVTDLNGDAHRNRFRTLRHDRLD